MTEELENPERKKGDYHRYISLTEEADHKTFSNHQKGLGMSITVLIFDEGELKCGNFPLSITPVSQHETTAKHNAELIQSVIKENKIEGIAKE